MIARSVLLALLLAAAAPAQAQSRSGKSEFYIGPAFTNSQSYVFEGGSSAQTDTGTGFNLGFAKNFDSHFLGGFELGWGSADYRATVMPGQGNLNSPVRINGVIETWSLRFLGTYHFLPGNFTPFGTFGAGWTNVDTNIPAGLPQDVCWYYPWWGPYCATYVPTRSTTKFSYNFGLGVRFDGPGYLLRGFYNQQWVDFGGNYGQAPLGQWRLEIGSRF